MREIHEVRIEEAARPAVYSLHERGSNQLVIPPSGMAVRAAVEPASIVLAIRQAIRSIDKNQPMWRAERLEDVFAHQLTTPTQRTALMSAFALLGCCWRQSDYMECSRTQSRSASAKSVCAWH